MGGWVGVLLPCISIPRLCSITRLLCHLNPDWKSAPQFKDYPGRALPHAIALGRESSLSFGCFRQDGRVLSRLSGKSDSVIPCGVIHGPTR